MFNIEERNRFVLRLLAYQVYQKIGLSNTNEPDLYEPLVTRKINIPTLPHTPYSCTLCTCTLATHNNLNAF
jgi:hypothetical protein